MNEKAGSKGAARAGGSGAKGANAGGEGRPGRGRGGERRPHGRDERSGRGRGGPGDRPASGRAGAEGTILATLKDIERPLNTGDYDGQKAVLVRILERLKPLRLKSIDELDFDCRTRLFTALLRVGRQPEQTEAEKEAKRKELLGLLGDVWQALSDDRRAALVYAAAGRTEPASRMLQKSGEWQEAAEVERKGGKPLEAARLYEQQGEWAKALEAFLEAGEKRGALRAALHAGDVEAARGLARGLELKVARELLFKHGGADLYLDLLAGRGDWVEIGNLYEKAGQWGDAALAFERGGRLLRAAQAWSKAGDAANSERCAQQEAQGRQARGDVVGAGEALRKVGLTEKAVELVRETRPELAFKWMQQGGLDAPAIAFAQQMARRTAADGRNAASAAWLERAGELPVAAQRFLEAGAVKDALRLFEQLGDWENAGEAAARANERERALEFWQRAGVPDAQERLARVAPAPVPGSAPEEPAQS